MNHAESVEDIQRFWSTLKTLAPLPFDGRVAIRCEQGGKWQIVSRRECPPQTELRDDRKLAGGFRRRTEAKEWAIEQGYTVMN